jgi:regulator of cell morphogenesis and NO signaling
MRISQETTVAEVASAIPASVPVLQRFGIDFCCGGKRPMSDACREQGLSFTDVAAAIEAATRTPAEERDWRQEPLHALTAHIVTTYHDRLREDLPRLETLAAKAAHAHAARSSAFALIRDVISELATGLLDHMRKEELILFPTIEAIEQGDQSRSAWLAQPIAVMEQEHDHAGALLTELRTVTNHYTVPEWGCATVRALYHGLDELESSMHMHVHLENNILFPRAMAPAAH